MYESISEKKIAAGRKAFLDGWFGEGKRPEPNLILVRAKGAKVWDHQGKEYIDCHSQVYVNTIGATHPKVTRVVEEQIKRIVHTAYGWDNIPLLLLSSKLAQIAPGDINRVSYCLSGSAAVEGAMKLALENKAPASCFITFERAYHGRSFATLAASFTDGEPTYPCCYMGNIVKVPEAYCYRCAFGLKYPDCNLKCAQFIEETIQKRTNGGVAGLIMEPVQGHGGQIDFPPEFYKQIREICTRNNILLIWDEIQTGFGRVGEMFAADLYGVVPDILLFGKAVAGGYPLCGFMARENLQGFKTARHSFTFAHSPVSLIAALATIEVVQEENLPARARKLNQLIMEQLHGMQAKYELIGDVRGPGLAIGVELVKNRETKEPAVEETKQIITMALERGVIFGTTWYGEGSVIKIKPPLTITEDEIHQALLVLEECISKVT